MQAAASVVAFSSTLTFQPKPKALDPFLVMRFDQNILRNPSFNEGIDNVIQKSVAPSLFLQNIFSFCRTFSHTLRHKHLLDKPSSIPRFVQTSAYCEFYSVHVLGCWVLRFRGRQGLQPKNLTELAFFFSFFQCVRPAGLAAKRLDWVGPARGRWPPSLLRRPLHLVRTGVYSGHVYENTFW